MQAGARPWGAPWNTKKKPDVILSVPLTYEETDQVSAWGSGVRKVMVTEQTSLPPSQGMLHTAPWGGVSVTWALDGF